MNTYMLLHLILTSCNSEPPLAPKTHILTSTKHSAAKESDFDEYAFFCCKDPLLKPVLNTYLQLVQAMGDDEEQKSLDLFSQLRTDLEKTNTADATFLVNELSKIQSDSLISIRSSFGLFSSALIKVIQNNKLMDNAEKNALKISVAFCPMAPGRWLQEGKIIHNPYFGSEMLTCGVFEP